MNKMVEIPEDLAQRLLSFQYVDNPGYGKIKCRSCRAEGFHDYDLNKVDREPCSKNCPFYRLEQAIFGEVPKSKKITND